MQQQSTQETENITPRQSQLDASMMSTMGNPNQTKFQFDIYINKVELTVPSPVYIFVQLLKGTNQVNTKKKVKIDLTNKVGVFGEKLSIVTVLNKSTDITTDGRLDYQQKVIQLRLMAFYNSKEKAIGICSLDLAQFTTLAGSGSKLA